MMRYPIKILFLLLLSFATTWSALGGASEEGAEAFVKGDFAASARAYETALSVGPKSAGLYYNLGMALMKDGQPASAAINFRRALMLDAHLVDARIALTNLERSQGLSPTTADWRARLAERVPLKTVLYVGSTLAWLGAFLLLYTIFKNGNKLWIGLAASFLLLVGGGLAGASYLSDPLIAEKNTGIVVDKEGVELLAAPADQSAVVTKLPLCAPLQILTRSGEWTYCAVPKGGKGWVQSSKVEAILPQT